VHFNAEIFEKEAIEFDIEFSDLVRAPIQAGSEQMKDLSQAIGGTFDIILPGSEDVIQRNILGTVSSDSFLVLDRPLIEDADKAKIWQNYLSYKSESNVSIGLKFQE